MNNFDPGPLARYNSLQDKHLAGYFGNTKIKKHLFKSGLVKKNGEIVGDNAYRVKMAKKEHRKHVRDLLATAIVHKALDIERMRQYEIRKKLNELYKTELVQRVKSERARKGDEEIVPLLLPKSGRKAKSSASSATSGSRRSRGSSASSSNTAEGDSSIGDPLPEIAYDDQKRRLYTKSAPPQGRAKRMSEEDSLPYRSHTYPHPPRKKKEVRQQIHRGLILARTDTAVAHRIQLQSLAEVMLKFIGPNLHLTNDMFSSHKLHEVMVLQQHCGGSTLCVFRELLPPNTNFSFISRRHRGSPFGLTLYIDSVQDIRISSCCEYKHRPGCKIGGKNAKFLFLGVTGAAPCYKCQVAFSVANETRSAKSKADKVSPKNINRPPSTDGDRKTGDSPHMPVEINVKDVDKERLSDDDGEPNADDLVTEKRPAEAITEESSLKTDKVTQTEDRRSPSIMNEKSDTEARDEEENNNEYDDEDFEVEDAEGQKMEKSDVEDGEGNYVSDFGSSLSSSSSNEEKEGNEDPEIRRRKKKRRSKQQDRDSEGGEIKTESEKESSASEEEGKPLHKDIPDIVTISDDEKDEEANGLKQKEDDNLQQNEVVLNSSSQGNEDKDDSKEDDDDKVDSSPDRSSDIEESKGDLEENREDIEENREDIEENKEDIEENKEDIEENKKAIELEKIGTGDSVQDSVIEDPTTGTQIESDISQKDEKIESSGLVQDPDDGNVEKDIAIHETNKEMGLDDNKEKDTEARGNIKYEAVNGEESSIQDGDKQEELVIKSTGEEGRSDDGADVGQSGTEYIERNESPNITKDDEDRSKIADWSNEGGHGLDNATNEDETVNEIGDTGNERSSGNEQQGETDVGADGTTDGIDSVADGGTDIVKDGGNNDGTDEEIAEKNEKIREDGIVEEDSKGDADALQEEIEIIKDDTARIVESKGVAQEDAKEEISAHLEAFEANNVKEENGVTDTENSDANVDPSGNKTEDQLVDVHETDIEAGKSEIDPGTSPEAGPKVQEADHPVEDGNAETGQVIDDDTNANAIELGIDNMNKDIDPTDNNIAEDEENKDPGSNEEKLDTKNENMDGEETALNNEEIKETVTPEDDSQEGAVVFEPNEELAHLENGKDPEVAIFDSGNDPDGVAEGNSREDNPPLETQTSIKHDGPISPLIDSTKDLELNSVALSPDQVEEISEVVSKNDVDSLSLRNATMDDEGIAKIKEAVSNSGNLKMLNLNLNNIGPAGAGHLAEVMKDNSSLKMLMLHGNHIGDDGIGYIVDQLLDNSNITTLDVGDCKIGDVGAMRIAELLEKNKGITDLNLSGNQISVKGWSVIADGIKKNTTLSTLSLDFNDLKDEGTEIICEGIRDNKSLKSVDFEGNKIGDIGGRRILAAVKNNLHILDVTLMPQNNISTSLQNEIKTILKERVR